MKHVTNYSTRYCFFDTETSDMIKFKAANDHPSQPWVVQLAAVVTDEDNNALHSFSGLVHSNGNSIAPGAQDVHGISKELCDTCGIQQGAILGTILNFFDSATHLVAHNIDFDLRVLEILANKIHPDALSDYNNFADSMPRICTMKRTTTLCKLPFPSGRGGYKWPKLEELYKFLFNEELSGAHDAMVDVDATRRCFFELKRREVL